MTGDDWFGVVFGVAAVATAIFRSQPWWSRVVLGLTGAVVFLVGVVDWRWLVWPYAVVVLAPVTAGITVSFVRALWLELTGRNQSPAAQRRAARRR
jgi:hypothetical protein